MKLLPENQIKQNFETLRHGHLGDAPLDPGALPDVPGQPLDHSVQDEGGAEVGTVLEVVRGLGQITGVMKNTVPVVQLTSGCCCSQGVSLAVWLRTISHIDTRPQSERMEDTARQGSGCHYYQLRPMPTYPLHVLVTGLPAPGRGEGRIECQLVRQRVGGVGGPQPLYRGEVEHVVARPVT